VRHGVKLGAGGQSCNLGNDEAIEIFSPPAFPVWAEADTWFERQQQEEELERLKKEHDENVRRGREQAVRSRCLCLSKKADKEISICQRQLCYVCGDVMDLGA
jgi:hypothetical protein